MIRSREGGDEVTRTDADEYVEAIAVWGEAGPSDVVHEWLARHGLNSVPMVAGLLITGSRQQFERAFQVRLGDFGRRSISLPIPDDLEPFVSSIEIPKPPTVHLTQR
jgi:hypothetical protein